MRHFIQVGRVCVCCGARNEPMGMLGYSTLPGCYDRAACDRRVANNAIAQRLRELAPKRSTP
jgi:hypothetical protein